MFLLLLIPSFLLFPFETPFLPFPFAFHLRLWAPLRSLRRRASLVPERGDRQGSRPPNDPETQKKEKGKQGRGGQEIKPETRERKFPLSRFPPCLLRALAPGDRASLAFLPSPRGAKRRSALSPPRYFTSLLSLFRSLPPLTKTLRPPPPSPPFLSLHSRSRSLAPSLPGPLPRTKNRRQATPPLDPRAPRPLPQGPRRARRARRSDACLAPALDEHRRPRPAARQEPPAEVQAEPQPRDRRRRRGERGRGRGRAGGEHGVKRRRGRRGGRRRRRRRRQRRRRRRRAGAERLPGPRDGPVAALP